MKRDRYPRPAYLSLGRKDLKAEVHDTGTRARALGGHLEPEDYTILRAAVHALIGNVVYDELRRHGMQHADAIGIDA